MGELAEDHLQEDLSTRQKRDLSFSICLCALRPSVDRSALSGDRRMSVCWIRSCLYAAVSDTFG